MHLFEVVRWGNDSDDIHTGGPDGADTCFLVRAGTLEMAVALVDAELRHMPHASVHDWAHVVYLLGDDTGAEREASRILRGPYLQHAYRHGWRQWSRASQGAPWAEREG